MAPGDEGGSVPWQFHGASIGGLLRRHSGGGGAEAEGVRAAWGRPNAGQKGRFVGGGRSPAPKTKYPGPDRCSSCAFRPLSALSSLEAGVSRNLMTLGGDALVTRSEFPIDPPQTIVVACGGIRQANGRRHATGTSGDLVLLWSTKGTF